MSNELAAGSEINQVQLADRFGTSRGPVREALRLLEQEGLVIATPNQRPRVAPVDAGAVDSAYAQRILLETLGLRLTVPGLSSDIIDRCRADIEHMLETGDRLTEYFAPHYQFHESLIAGLPDPLRSAASTLFEKTERYRRLYAVTSVAPIAIAAEEHHSILAACEVGDLGGAMERLAKHYARTSLEVLARFAPEFEPRAIRGALAVATGAVELTRPERARVPQPVQERGSARKGRVR